MSGGERSLLLLLRGLPDDILPVLACPEGPLDRAARAVDVPWVRVTGTAGSLKLHPIYTPRAVRELLRAALEVRRACDELGIDVVHANSIRAGLIAALARRLGGPAVVAHIRDVLPAGAMSTVTGRLLGASADVIVANSRYTREHLPAGAIRSRTKVVHNPVDLNRFDPDRVDRSQIRDELGLGKDAHLLTMVAQITPWKGQDTAIKALAGLRGRGHDAHLALAGSAKFVDKATRFDNEAYLQHLHGLIGELGLDRQVSFLGEREDVPAILAATDVLLMPSWQEPFGRAIIEAMAMGTAVVATDVGGAAEIITDDVDGLLLPPTEPRRWVTALDRLLTDPQRLQGLGAAGLGRADAFAVERHVKAILDVYAPLKPAVGAVTA
ncbi:MAG TPA: glycosyltransferase family 4 protein [Solirubrobacteraceae bacterium]|jgi:glycosyltransferase involved in cell wall biosynthesis